MSRNTTSNLSFNVQLIAATVILLCASYVTISTLTFFVSDTGLRFLQIRQLIEQDWHTFSIMYPGRFVDPTGAHFPYYYAFSVVKGQIFLHISPFFPLLAAVLYSHIGVIGLSVIPVLGTVVTAWATYRLLRLSEVEPARLAFWATAFATPLLFYSLELWDHTIGTALMLLGVYGVARGIRSELRVPTVLGGIAIGLAPGQRPEAYVFGIALGGALLVAVRARRRWEALAMYVAGGLLGVLPVWILQYRWIGHPLGISTARRFLGFGRPEVIPFTPAGTETLSLGQRYFIKISRLLFHTDAPPSVLATVLITIGILYIVLVLRSERRQKSVMLIGGLVILLTGYAIVAKLALDRPVTGLISTFPLITLSVLYVSDEVDSKRAHIRRVYVLILLTVSLYLGLSLAIGPAYGGKQWGAQYLLSAYPLLLFLAFYAYEQYRHYLDEQVARILRGSTILLLLLSVLLQVLGARILYIEHREQAAMRDTIEQMPARVVITNGPYLASLMSSLDKIFLYADDEDEVRTLLRRLAQDDIEYVAIIPLDEISLDVPETVEGTTVNHVDTFVYRLTNEE